MDCDTPDQHWLEEMANIQAGIRVMASKVDRLQDGLRYVLNDAAYDEMAGIAENMRALASRLNKATNAKVHADYSAQCEATNNMINTVLAVARKE